MSAGNNDVLILLAAAAAYMYIKKTRTTGVAAPVYQGGVATMPGSVGTGNNQVQTGALLGFLQSVAGSFGPNTSSGYVQPTNIPVNYGALQDAAYDAYEFW